MDKDGEESAVLTLTSGQGLVLGWCSLSLEVYNCSFWGKISTSLFVSSKPAPVSQVTEHGGGFLHTKRNDGFSQDTRIYAHINAIKCHSYALRMSILSTTCESKKKKEKRSWLFISEKSGGARCHRLINPFFFFFSNNNGFHFFWFPFRPCTWLSK